MVNLVRLYTLLVEEKEGEMAVLCTSYRPFYMYQDTDTVLSDVNLIH